MSNTPSENTPADEQLAPLIAAIPQPSIEELPPYTPFPPEDSEYARLLAALGLKQQQGFTALPEIMRDTKMSLWSDCARRGWILTLPAIQAAGRIGVNPGYLLFGPPEPMYRAGYAEPMQPGAAPVKAAS